MSSGRHVSRDPSCFICTILYHLPTLCAVTLDQPVLIAMVGLPARGKSYLVKMLTRYLTYIGFESKVFNVGSYRRDIGLASMDSSFFDSENKVSEERAG